MGFQTALSGLNAAQGNLDVISNNVANGSTTGFKGARAEFSDVYAVSFGGVSSTATGSGVRLSKVAQQFTQGNIDFTNNNLDLAVSGEGFFVLNDNGSTLYSRAGNFSVDRSGYVVNSHGQRLQTYAVDPNTGSVSNFTPQDLQFNLGANPARATANIGINLNLDASAKVATVKPLDIADPASYNFSTTTTVYDSLGVTHDATLYFQKTTATTNITLGGTILNAGGAAAALAPINTNVYDSLGNSYPATITYQQTGATTWTAAVSVNGGAYTTTANIDYATTPPTVANNTINGVALGVGTLPADLTIDFSNVTMGTATTAAVSSRADNGPPRAWNTLMALDGQTFDKHVLQFNTDGSLANSPATIAFNDGTGAFNPTNASPMSLTIDFTGSTEFGANSAVNNVVQDGYTTGRLSGVSVDASGVVFARYTNGQSTTLGAVALARFANPNGLQQVGDTNWASSFESGSAQAGQAGTGTFGKIQSGALEASNVEISKQLVQMILAQRDFQANAKMITTEDTVTQAIINIR